MNRPSSQIDPPFAAEVASVVLGAVGLLLFFLPILSIPLGGVGVLCGLFGLALAARGGRPTLRWSVVGLVISGAALTIAVSIFQAPAGYLPTRAIPLNAQPSTESSYVPPPARPN